jgi:hypothetical protein
MDSLILCQLYNTHGQKLPLPQAKKAQFVAVTGMEHIFSEPVTIVLTFLLEQVERHINDDAFASLDPAVI